MKFYLSRQFPTFLPWMTPLLVALGPSALRCWSPCHWHAGEIGGFEPSLGAWRWPEWRPPLWQCCSRQLRGRFLPWTAGTAAGIGPAAGPMTRFGPGGGMPPAVRERFGERRAYDGQDRPRGGGQPPGGFGAGADAKAQTRQLVAWLQAHQPGSTYLLAVQGSNQAGQYILAGASVLLMGGFSGRVPFPTTGQLAELVADGQLRYVLLGERGDSRPGGVDSTDTTTWVKNTCTVVTDSALSVSDLYDCAR